MEAHAFPPVRNCWFLTGPTASGKSRLALPLARLLDAEILSLDSMAVYVGMDIGTAKPTRADRAATPHHLLDLVAPDHEFSLADYLTAAHACVADVQGRGKRVLFVGGTPLYLKALLRGLCEGPPADWDFRRAVEAEIREVGVDALHDRLRQVDPLAAAKLHPNDQRRIIRALEVNHLTGRPLSHLQTQFDELAAEANCRVATLEWPRSELHARIERRVEQMFAAGLVEEVRDLQSRYGGWSRTAMQAVGYAEVLDHLQGRIDLPTAVERVQARTRQFARRQETWFRSLSECRRAPLSEASQALPPPEELARQIFDQISAGGL